MKVHPGSRSESVPMADSHTDIDFTFVDLFAGVGGMRLGFEAIGGRCIYTCEKDPHARAAYAANFVESSDHAWGEHVEVAVEEDAVPPHNVLLAGFPCQPFSLAGVSKRNALGYPHGFECPTQGTMFGYIVDILARHQPEVILLENVKNLKSHDGGNTFRTILGALAELGYDVDHVVIDARRFVPQHRERTFIAGFRESIADGFSFDGLKLPDRDDGPRLASILHETSGETVAEEPYTVGSPPKVNPKYTLSPKLWAYLRAYAERHRKAGNGFGYGLVGPEDVSRTISARYYKDGAEILVRQGRGRRPRRLTPREAARLMGFDVPGVRRWNLPTSDVQAYRQMGNAVVPQVVEAVAEYMKPFIAASLGQGPAPALLLPAPGQLRLGRQTPAAA